MGLRYIMLNYIKMKVYKETIMELKL